MVVVGCLVFLVVDVVVVGSPVVGLAGLLHLVQLLRMFLLVNGAMYLFVWCPGAFGMAQHSSGWWLL